MADLTLTERVYALEDQVRSLTKTFSEHLASVVLIEKPMPTVRTVRKKRKKKVGQKSFAVRKGFVKTDA